MRDFLTAEYQFIAFRRALERDAAWLRWQEQQAAEKHRNTAARSGAAHRSCEVCGVKIRPHTFIAALNLGTVLLIRQAPDSFGRTVALLCCGGVAALIILLALRDLLDPPL